MPFIKKFFQSLAIVVLVLAGILAYAVFKAETYLIAELRSQLSENLGPRGIQVDFKNLKLNWMWGGLQVRVQRVGVFGTVCSQVEIEEVVVSLFSVGELLKPKDLIPDLRVVVKNPSLTCEVKSTEGTSPEAPPSLAPLAVQSLKDLKDQQPLLKDLRISFEIEKLSLELRREGRRVSVLKDFSTQFLLENLMAPVKVNMTGLAKVDQPSVPFWIVFSAIAQLKYENGKIIFEQGQSQILSVVSQLTGEIDLNTKTVSLALSSQISELQKLPPPPKNIGLPIVAWSGTLNSSVKISGPFRALLFEGQFQLAKAQFAIDSRSDDVIANGELRVDLAFDFKSAESFSITKYSADFDLTGLNVSYGKLFNKPSEIPLLLRSKGKIDRDWVMDSLFLKLDQLETEIRGQIDLSPGKTALASLSVNLHPTTLAGLERFILPLSAHAVGGSASLKGTFEGDLKKPAEAKFEISDMSLKNVSTQIKFASRTLLVDGPLEFNLEGKLTSDKLNVLAGRALLKADLSGLSMTYLNVFSKKQLEPLKINLSAEKNAGLFSLKSSQIATKAGVIEVFGQPPLSLSAPMKVQLLSNSLSLTQLKTWLPSYRPHIPDGELKFNLALNGKIDSENPLKSLLAVSGAVAGRLPKYVLVKSEPAVKVQTLVEKPKPPPAFMNDENLIHNTQLALDLIVDEFEMGDLKASGIHLKSDLKIGQLDSALNISQIFGGSVVMPRLSFNLFQPDPILKFDLKTKSVQIDSLLNWALPQYEKLMSGQVDVSSQGIAKLPWAPDFSESILAEGDFLLAKGRLNTFEISDLINQFFTKLKEKIPGMGSHSKAQVVSFNVPLRAQMNGKYKLKTGQLTLNPFRALTSENDEIFLQGFVDGTLNMGLVGTAAVKSEMSGDFYEANKDGQGRLEIPLKIQGSPLKPEFSFAEEALSKMATKVLAYEQKKVVQSLEKNLIDKTKSDVTKGVQKKKKEVSDNLKKKVQDLFIDGD